MQLGFLKKLAYTYFILNNTHRLIVKSYQTPRAINCVLQIFTNRIPRCWNLITNYYFFIILCSSIYPELVTFIDINLLSY